MMKASSFSLADLLSILAAVAFGFICFLGLNFLTEGDLTSSILIALGIVFILEGLAYAAKRLKTARKYFKLTIIAEVLSIILFTVLFFFISRSVFPHYFTVCDKKEEIKEKLSSSIDGATRMFEEYESYAADRESLYEAKLKSVVAAKKACPSDYKNYGFGAEGISDKDQIDNKLTTLHLDLFPSNYSGTASQAGTKDIAIKWLNSQKAVVEDWKAIGIPVIAKELPQRASNWCSELIEYSKVREKGEIARDFSYELTFGDVSSLLTEKKRPKTLPVIISIVIWALMLFSWLITERDSRFPGFKRVFRKDDNTLDNEL